MYTVYIGFWPTLETKEMAHQGLSLFLHLFYYCEMKNEGSGSQMVSPCPCFCPNTVK